jgi:hypothetical protein
MNSEEAIEDRDDWPDYRAPEQIAEFELRNALCGLHLLGRAPYLRMQAFNLSVVDQFIMQLECDALRKLQEDDSTPLPEAIFLSAQSQMWIFAVYELLRTWRARSKNVCKLAENGGIKLKIEALEKKLGYLDVGREIQAHQLRQIQDDPTLIRRIYDDLRITEIPFVRLEHIRVALAKHEFRGKEKSIAHTPGYGRINQWCGSLDYEIGTGGAIIDVLNRRDIAEGLRAISDRSNPPTDADLASFAKFMKGPATDPFAPAKPQDGDR